MNCSVIKKRNEKNKFKKVEHRACLILALGSQLSWKLCIQFSKGNKGGVLIGSTQTRLPIYLLFSPMLEGEGGKGRGQTMGAGRGYRWRRKA